MLEHVHSSDEVEVPPEVAQEGVARGAGIELRHVAQFVRPLIRDGYVHERIAHVTGKRQRRKVYELTHSGRALAIHIRERARDQGALVVRGASAREKGLDDSLQRIGMKASVLETVREVQPAGVLGLETPRRPSEAAFVDQTWDAPRIGTFVGRRAELAEILREDGGARLLVIRGVAGIGKTALAAKACDLVRGQRNLFWHRIRPWETDRTVLASLGQFLRTLDRPGLGSVLKRGEADLAAEVLRQDLPDARALLVFDDAHEASAEASVVFEMLADAVAGAQDVKVLLLTRRALAFYDVRAVALEGRVQELELGGLRTEDAAALAADGGDSAVLAGLGRRLAGHPLFIELVRRHRADIPRAIQDVRRFVEVAVYRELSKEERAVMKAASLYEVPVPRQTLLSIPGSAHDVLAELQDRSLVRFVGRDRYEVHDTIREFFRDALTAAESRTFGALAVEELRGLAAKDAADGDFVSCVNYLSNAIRLARGPQERAEIWEGLGDAEERLGDPPAALVVYREAIRASKGAESVARLHRKLASALQVLGEAASASAEADAALESLGGADHAERGWVDLVRSRMRIAEEDWSEGGRRAEAAVRAFRSFRDARGQVEALIELAAVHTGSPSGEPDLARGHLEEALKLSEAIADPALTAKVHVRLANLYAYRLGDADRAMKHLDAIEALPGALADVHSRQSLLLLKGWFNLDLRAAFEEARADFLEALALSWKLHDPVNAASARHGAALVAFHAGDYTGAKRQLEVAADELIALGCPGASVEALYEAAEVCLAAGDVEGFRRLAARAGDRRFAHGLEVRPVVARILDGVERLGKGDGDGARGAFLEAIRVAERLASPLERPFIPFAHDMYGAALGAMGAYGEAAEHDRLAIESAQRFGLKGRLVARVKIIPGIQGSLRQMFTAAARGQTTSTHGGNS